MKNRFTSLISILSFFAGSVACSGAGDVQADSRGRDSQALSDSNPDGEVAIDGVEPNAANSWTLGGNSSNSLTTGGLTIGSPSTVGSGSLTLEPARSSEVVVEEPGRTTTLTPGDDGVPEVIGASELEPTTITWGDADAGVEIQLGADIEAACGQLRSACRASGETEETCDGLVAQCEEAIAHPSEPTDDIRLVTDCDEVGVSCRAAGVDPKECEAAVALCKNTDAGASTESATIVTSCEELRASCAKAGLSDAQCDEAVAACESPATPSDSEVGLGVDCSALLASCLSYGIAQAECKEVQKECEEAKPAAGGSGIRLK